MNLISRGVRRFGSAGIDLAYLACGRFDGYWEYDLNVWDIAPGVLLVREAGGTVTSLTGGAFDLESGTLCASNGPLHPALLEALAVAQRHPANSREGLLEQLPAELAARVEL